MGIKFCAGCGYELTGLANEGTCPECACDYTIYSVRRAPRTAVNMMREWMARQWKRAPIISPIIAMLTLVVFAPMTCSPVGVHDYMFYLWILLGGPVWVLIVIIKLLINSIGCEENRSTLRRWIDRVRWFAAPVFYGLALLLIVSGWGWDIRWAMHRSSMTTTAESLRGNDSGYQFGSHPDQPPGGWFVLEQGEPAWLSLRYHSYAFGDKSYVLMVYSPDYYPPSLNVNFYEWITLDQSLGPYPRSLDPARVHRKSGGWWRLEAW